MNALLAAGDDSTSPGIAGTLPVRVKHPAQTVGLRLLLCFRCFRSVSVRSVQTVGSRLGGWCQSFDPLTATCRPIQ